MENKEYDVVIVGSGIAGAVVAKTLTQAGKSVLLLEAGLQAGIAFEPEAAYQNYQYYLETFYKASAKVPNSPYPNIEDAQSPNVLDIAPIVNGVPSAQGYLVQAGPLPFASDCYRGAGGTTLHWLGSTPRMLPNDFKIKTLYGKAVDWPISYDELKAYYEMAENEIGVSGDVDEQQGPDMGRANYGKEYVFPMKKIPQSYLDQVCMARAKNLKVKLGKKEYKIIYASMPQGRNSDPDPKYKYTEVSWDAKKRKLELKEREQKNDIYEPVGAIWDQATGQRCEGNASCVPICPVQAKYNALKTLRKSNFSKLDIITQAVASRVLIDAKSKKITGVEYKKYKYENSTVYDTIVATGKVYVLAASAIENAKLLLASNAANTSDQVGRNLMDHMVLLTWGLLPEKAYPFRGPGSTTNISTFRDGDFRKQHAPWISPLDNWGWTWPEFSPGSDVAEALSSGMFGKKLRAHLHDILTRQLLLHFECEQLPEADNRVTIDPQYKDQIGNYRPVIHYNASEYMGKAFEAAKAVSDQIFEAYQVQDFTSYSAAVDPDYVVYKGKGYNFRGAGHIVGTHRMGFNKNDSVVNADQRTWDHDNLYLVGCGNMPTLGTSNPTLTMTALTFKASEAILKQLEK
jgi:choline dehydrogenase-like flavoprotein